ncbi:hypothetical protein FS837_005032, partial [Tulasnella sp. UAMH 9824]
TGSMLGEPLKGHSDSVRSVAFSPDSKTLASGSHDGTIRLWHAQTGSPLGEPLKGHSNSVRSVAFSPDSKTLASGSHDGTIRLWDAQTGSPLGERPHSYYSRVSSVAFSPDGKTLASVSDDGTIHLWNAETRECLHGHRICVGSVAVSANSKLRTRIHQPNTTQFTSWREIHLFPQGQWVTLDHQRLLWLPDKYWSENPVIAKLFKGTLAFASDRFVSCFDVSGVLGLPVE